MTSYSSTVQDFWALLKPRVMSLVIFTAFVGLKLAPGNVHPFLAGVSILCIAIAAGAAGALNMWYERELDARMKRTAQRPLPSGKMDPHEALAFGLILSFLSVLVMGLALNYVAAGLLAFTILFYSVVYTIGLKPRTAQNIVIGGAAGALPPVVGWASVTGSMALEPWILFLIIFLWTPPHFWALSLSQAEDYQKARIPMLPVVVGSLKTRQYIFYYSFALVLTSLIPYGIGLRGSCYGACAFIFGAIFMVYAYLTLRQEKQAMRLFFYSIFYLFILFGSMLLDQGLQRGVL
jgi:protoheme IX farnesyltransferase